MSVICFPLGACQREALPLFLTVSCVFFQTARTVSIFLTVSCVLFQTARTVGVFLTVSCVLFQTARTVSVLCRPGVELLSSAGGEYRPAVLCSGQREHDTRLWEDREAGSEEGHGSPGGGGGQGRPRV